MAVFKHPLELCCFALNLNERNSIEGYPELGLKTAFILVLCFPCNADAGSKCFLKGEIFNYFHLKYQ